MNYGLEDRNIGSADPHSSISFEGIDLSTAARQASDSGPELSRLAPGDLLDNDDLCVAPLIDGTGLNDLLSGDLSSLAL